MRKMLTVLILLGLVAIALPMTAAALGLDVEAKAGAGLGLGSTDNKDVTGSPRMATGAGVNIDVFLLSLGSAELGISAGAEYSHMTFHSTWSNFMSTGSDQTQDSTYGYFNVPISLVCSIPVNQSIKVVVRAGGFIGSYLAGFSDLTYNPEIPFVLVNGRQPLDSTNTIKMNYGLHFTAGTDIGLGGGLAVAPAIQFDWGLTDVTKNTPQAGSFKDTLWALTVVVGIKYSVL
jgi:Outer membrane protein beta-barrel domain